MIPSFEQVNSNTRWGGRIEILCFLKKKFLQNINFKKEGRSINLGSKKVKDKKASKYSWIYHTRDYTTPTLSHATHSSIQEFPLEIYIINNLSFYTYLTQQPSFTKLFTNLVYNIQFNYKCIRELSYWIKNSSTSTDLHNS